jgi:hypothetical protein
MEKFETYSDGGCSFNSMKGVKRMIIADPSGDEMIVAARAFAAARARRKMMGALVKLVDSGKKPREPIITPEVAHVMTSEYYRAHPEAREMFADVIADWHAKATANLPPALPTHKNEVGDS